MAGKQTKVIVRRRKFLEVEIPVIRSKIELIGNSPEELQGRTIKLDLTRQLKGKSVEAVVKIKLEDKKLIATPEKIKLMPYFIRRMIRKKISYVEDSFLTPSQENMLLIKPFLITRKRVSRAVRKTLRNKCRNYLQDYIAEKTNAELFNEILTNKLQKSLSLYLKKTYPLSLCEIRILEIKRPLNPEEVPKIKPKPIEEKKKIPEEEIIDQLAEIEQERIKKAEKEIKQTQEIAAKIEEKQKDNKEKEPKKRGRKKESKNKEE
jgi:ribosomal protein S3AE